MLGGTWLYKGQFCEHWLMRVLAHASQNVWRVVLSGRNLQSYKIERLLSTKAAEDAGSVLPHPSQGSRLAELMDHPEVLKSGCKPRYPIVLCHGLFGFDVRGPFWGLEFRYWSTTIDVLRDVAKAEVHVFEVPPTGSIEERAKSLHRFLCDPVNGLRGRHINFIGHSMGGLDVRYLISTIRPHPSEYIPASLTTLATPHRGSPIMDWCSENFGVGWRITEDLLQNAEFADEVHETQESSDEQGEKKTESSLLGNAWLYPANGMSRMFSDMSNAFNSYMVAAFDQPAFGMLSTTYMNKSFNPETQDSPNVQYFSVAARVRNMAFWHPLWLPKLVMDKSALSRTPAGISDGSADAKYSDRGNDGVVSISSAKWGTFLGVMEGWDHWGLRGPGVPERFRPVDHRVIREREDRIANRKMEKEHEEAVISTYPMPLARGWLAINEALSSIGITPLYSSQRYDESSWDWLDVIRAQNKDQSNSQNGRKMSKILGSATDDGETKVAHKIADWIASYLPKGFGSVRLDPAAFKQLFDERRKAMSPFRWLSTLRGEKQPDVLESTAGLQRPPRNTETHPRFWLALCRNLRESGL